MHTMDVENQRLTNTMKEMVESYTTQLELRDETIQQMNKSDAVHQSEVTFLVQKENEALKQENRMLRDKLTILEEEINLVRNQRPL